MISTTNRKIIFAAASLAVLFHYSGTSNKSRFLQSLKFVAVIVSILLLCEGSAVLWRNLHEISMRKHPELPWRSIWQIRYVAIVMPAVWLGAAALIGRLPTRYLQIAAVLMICFYNTANVLAREYVQTTVPLDRAMADMYLSQPGSKIRTYFGLKSLTENVYYRPLAAYNACIAARLKPTPADFRDGYAWPFQWGTVAAKFKAACIYNSTITAKQLRRDTKENSQINQIILWDILNRGAAISSMDAATQLLEHGWTQESEEKITGHWYWSWGDMSQLRRRVFRKNPAS